MSAYAHWPGHEPSSAARRAQHATSATLSATRPPLRSFTFSAASSGSPRWCGSRSTVDLDRAQGGGRRARRHARALRGPVTAHWAHAARRPASAKSPQWIAPRHAARSSASVAHVARPSPLVNYGFTNNELELYAVTDHSHGHTRGGGGAPHETGRSTPSQNRPLSRS